ncbi:hypothetical protein GCM10025881_23630 [Pseudolysinimonas kribbensis]|uniref:Amidohydrolase-related domain-containing protein n=1 Tax=Pseudolysinimonas kribbensis TaxID=433641 RepID=A0ABQ6K8D0_9MICO|nr:hypothetical protein GCM10025881_23630 [Pseudolysinimonas kribbensis]
MATLLPATDLSTREAFPPARELIDAGATVALASNCNPGSSYTTSMPFCVATAVLQLRLTLDEALRAATRGGARALRLSDDTGTLVVGGPADLQLLDAPSVSHLAYRPGVPLTRAVWRKGRALSELHHDPLWPRAGDWPAPTPGERADVAIVGVPTWSTSITPGDATPPPPPCATPFAGTRSRPG